MVWEPVPLSPSVSPQSSKLGERRARRDEQGHPRHAVGVGLGEHRLAHVVGGVRDPRAVGDGALQPVAAVLRRGADRRGGDRGGAEVPAGEHLVLRALGKPGADLERVVGRQARPPRGAHVAARQLDADAHEGGHVDLESAVAPRDVHAVEARLQQRLVDLRGVGGTLLGLTLLGDELLSQRAGAGHELITDALHLPSLLKGAHRLIVGSGQSMGGRECRSLR